MKDWWIPTCLVHYSTKGQVFGSVRLSKSIYHAIHVLTIPLHFKYLSRLHTVCILIYSEGRTQSAFDIIPQESQPHYKSRQIRPFQAFIACNHQVSAEHSAVVVVATPAFYSTHIRAISVPAIKALSFVLVFAWSNAMVNQSHWLKVQTKSQQFINHWYWLCKPVKILVVDYCTVCWPILL